MTAMVYGDLWLAMCACAAFLAPHAPLPSVAGWLQVLDCNDVCPDDADLAHATDALDSDGDGVLDCNDLCPHDASRINDVDTDGDSVRCSHRPSARRAQA